MKRKCVYLDSYEKEFKYTKKSTKGDEFAHCTICQDDINLVSIGKSAITQHQNTSKHKKAENAAKTSKGIEAFMPSTSAPTNLDRQTAAAEGENFIVL